MASMLAEVSAKAREKRDPNVMIFPLRQVFLFQPVQTNGGEKSGRKFCRGARFFSYVSGNFQRLPRTPTVK
jgi:hypothetical protein